VSRRREGEGFEPHEGDPWHPEWDSGVEQQPEDGQELSAEETGDVVGSVAELAAEAVAELASDAGPEVVPTAVPDLVSEQPDELVSDVATPGAEAPAKRHRRRRLGKRRAQEDALPPEAALPEAPGPLVEPIEAAEQWDESIFMPEAPLEDVDEEEVEEQTTGEVVTGAPTGPLAEASAEALPAWLAEEMAEDITTWGAAGVEAQPYAPSEPGIKEVSDGDAPAEDVMGVPLQITDMDQSAVGEPKVAEGPNGATPAPEEPMATEDEAGQTELRLDEPAVDEAVVGEPAVDEAVVGEPLVDGALVDEALVDEPVVDEPVVGEPVVGEPVVGEPVVDEAAIEALGGLDEQAAEDLDEWRAYVEEAPEIVDAGSPAIVVEPGPADPFVVEAPPEKSGLFGRRRRRVDEVPELAAMEDVRLGADIAAAPLPSDDQAEAQPPPWEPPQVAPAEAEPVLPEEAAAWQREAASVPQAWFSDIDEDVVQVPPALLPEQEEGEPVVGSRAEAPQKAPPGGPEIPGELTGDIFTGAVTMEHRGLAEEMLAAEGTDTELQALAAPMAGLDTGVVGFADLGAEEMRVEAVHSDLGLRVITGVVLIGLLLGALWVSGELLAGFIGVLAMLGLVEFYGTLRTRGFQPLALFGYAGGIGLLAGTWFYGLQAIPAAAISTTVIVFFFYAFAPNRRDALTNGGLTVLGVLWVTGSIAFLFPIIAAEDFRILVLAFAASTVAMDVGAYFFGRAWGSSSLAPVLSPNKTVEGLAGGVILAIVAAVAMGYQFEPLDTRSGAVLGLIVAVVAPLGDLAESMLKRSLGVKDMGSVLPGHGGILDRIDAFLFVLPATWVLYQALGLLA